MTSFAFDQNQFGSIAEHLERAGLREGQRAENVVFYGVGVDQVQTDHPVYAPCPAIALVQGTIRPARCWPKPKEARIICVDETSKASLGELVVTWGFVKLICAEVEWNGNLIFLREARVIKSMQVDREIDITQQGDYARFLQEFPQLAL